MELEKLSIALRPRNGWEAIDLGVRLVMRHARAIYLPWLALCIPLAILFIAAGEWLFDSGGWGYFAFWWLRPAFDRILLFSLSRVVFGETPDVRSCLRALPGLLRRSSLFSALSWRRLSPQRSLHLPVDMLEGLQGKSARQRRTLISRRMSGAATALTLVWSNLEFALSTAAMLLLIMLIPNEILSNIDWRHIFSDPVAQRLVDYGWIVFMLLCHLALEPLYVAGGFMLYLKRRNDLEAWDVELQFRKLTRRHQLAHGFVQASLAIVVCVVILLAPHAGYAQSADASAPAAQTPSAADSVRERDIAEAPARLARIMRSTDFGASEPHHELRWRKHDVDTQPWNFPDWLTGWMKALARVFGLIGKLVAAIGRAGAWLLSAVVIVALLLILLRNARGWGITERRNAPPAELAGFDIRPQSLPDDVAAAARALLANGQTREALSLLFRGALSALAWRDHVPFARGDTEGDCLDRVRTHAHVRFLPLSRLLACWQQTAYANRIPAAAQIEALCEEWPQHFALKSGAGNV